MARGSRRPNFLGIEELRNTADPARPQNHRPQETITMSDTLDAQALADLLDDLLAYLKANPDADLEDFADSHGCSVDDISDSWNTYFSADFSRKYDIDTDYHPSQPPHGDPQAIKEYIVNEVNNYQEFTTVNNIEDNSFNQQIIAGGDVNQDIDIDNSDNIADDGGVLVRDSELDDTNITTGDRNVVDSDGNNVTGDVSTEVNGDGQAATNFNFGDGDVDNRQQNADIDVSTSGDNTSTGGDGGDADTDGGDGGAGGKAGDGGDGGDGSSDGGLLDLGSGDGGDGGLGGDGGAGGGSATAGGDAGAGGDGGDAGNTSNVNVDFGG
jgi:hypothetical protein